MTCVIKIIIDACKHFCWWWYNCQFFINPDKVVIPRFFYRNKPFPLLCFNYSNVYIFRLLLRSISISHFPFFRFEMLLAVKSSQLTFSNKKILKLNEHFPSSITAINSLNFIELPRECFPFEFCIKFSLIFFLKNHNVGTRCICTWKLWQNYDMLFTKRL